jgi:hypothetical protein
VNFGQILGSISPAYGIASGQGLGAQLGGLSPILALLRGHHEGNKDMAADPMKGGDGGPGMGPATGDVSDMASAIGAPGAVPGAMPAARPSPTGGLHGVAFGGQPNMNGILSALSMFAPGGRRF